MRRYEMVKSHEDFNEIINTGKKYCGQYMIIFAVTKEFEKPNFGIAVGKKLGNAVIRNKIKRQIRNIVDKHRLYFKNYHNYIIMVRKEANKASFELLEKDMINILGKD